MVALRDFVKLIGFHPVVNQEYSRNYQSGQLHVGCTLNLNIKAYNNPKLALNKTIIADGQEEITQAKATAHPDWTNLTSIVNRV